ncbi:MAG: hypothetical protein M1161_04230 [Candidatus Thermoplasmatota archaeon]|nr:hypothetical protein [Candidatus Thermoplasmatota archaeon]
MNTLPSGGGSAGAIILGKDIGTAYFGGDADKNEVGLKDLKGLDAEMFPVYYSYP